MPLVQHLFHSAIAYALRVVLATSVELLLVGGPFVLLAATMQVVVPWRERSTERLIGRRAAWLAGGWLSTALHELGHAWFALLSGHEITGVKLFDFQARDGPAGYGPRPFITGRAGSSSTWRWSPAAPCD